MKTREAQADIDMLIGNASQSNVLSEIHKYWITRRILWNIIRVARNETGSYRAAVNTLNKIRKRFRHQIGVSMYPKIVEINHRYFWRLATPGYPSKALDQSHLNEISRIQQDGKPRSINLVILSVTCKCPLRCQHCYEWKRLNRRETLSIGDLHEIVEAYQDYGTSVFFFGGGEPMLRLNDLCEVVRQAKPTSDFWMYTSGYRLGRQEAGKLKEAGLTGVIVSIDHHEREKHDLFRGMDGIYDQATAAIAHCHNVKLGTAMAVCITRDFISESNIRKYMDLAKVLGVDFVQLLEPKPAGRFQGQEVSLGKEELALAERLTTEYNTSGKYHDYPIVLYPESMVRKIGCLSGERMIFINSAGMIQQCPFCDHTIGHVLDIPPEEAHSRMCSMKCQDYEKAIL